MGERAKNDFPNTVKKYPDYWYTFKDKGGTEHTCELVYTQKPNLKSIDAIGWESMFLQVPADAQAFRNYPPRTYPAKLLCGDKAIEPVQIKS